MTKMQRRGLRIAALGLVAVFALGLAAAPAFAGGKAPNGLQVAIDPATGKIRQPTAAEARAFAGQFAGRFTTKAAPQFTQWADGTLSMVLTPDYLNVWLVGLNSDGSTSPVCVDGFAAGSAAAPAMEEK
jgi:hypothetical protein